MVQFKVPQVRGLKGKKEAKITVNGIELGVAVVSGLQNARELLEEIRNGRDDIHFVEVMACPGGCIAGGGQRIGADQDDIKARMKALYQIDETDSIKVSHKNPEIKELYETFLGEPGSHICHELLHTHYEKREILK
jgi:iron only hydrogenase large subunit-like protein